METCKCMYFLFFFLMHIRWYGKTHLQSFNMQPHRTHTNACAPKAICFGYGTMIRIKWREWNEHMTLQQKCENERNTVERNPKMWNKSKSREERVRIRANRERSERRWSGELIECRMNWCIFIFAYIDFSASNERKKRTNRFVHAVKRNIEFDFIFQWVNSKEKRILVSMQWRNAERKRKKQN